MDIPCSIKGEAVAELSMTLKAFSMKAIDSIVTDLSATIKCFTIKPSSTVCRVSVTLKAFSMKANQMSQVFGIKPKYSRLILYMYDTIESRPSTIYGLTYKLITAR